jgi:hypothetical protein
LYATAAPSTNPVLRKQITRLAYKVKSLEATNLVLRGQVARLAYKGQILEGSLEGTQMRALSADCSASLLWLYVASLRSALLAGDPPPDPESGRGHVGCA